MHTASVSDWRHHDSLNCKIGDCSDAHCLASNCTRERCIPHDSSAKTNSDLIQVLVYTQFRLGNAHVLNINKLLELSAIYTQRECIFYSKQVSCCRLWQPIM